VSKSSTYKLLKATEGITLFGEATVSVSMDSKLNRIVFSEHVFDWLKQEYGQNATIWPVTDENEYVKGARKGVEHVVRHLPPEYSGRNVSFTVERLFVSPVDSTEDTIAYAACFAAWQALGVKPVMPPMIQGRQIVFEQ